LKAIFSITRGIRTSLSLYDYIKNKSRGLFTSVLVDVDLLSDLPNHIMVERSRFVFIADVEYEKLPLFYSNCKIIGHDLYSCRHLQCDPLLFLVGEKIWRKNITTLLS